LTLAPTVFCTSNVGDVEPAVKTAIALPLASVVPLMFVIVAPLGLGGIIVKLTAKPLTRLPDPSFTIAVRMLFSPAFSDVFSGVMVMMYPDGTVEALAVPDLVIMMAAVAPVTLACMVSCKSSVGRFAPGV